MHQDRVRTGVRSDQDAVLDEADRLNVLIGAEDDMQGCIRIA